MATLTALKFDTAEGAGRMVQALGDLQQQRLITVQDAATVSWPTGWPRRSKSRGLQFALIASNLSQSQEAKLKEVFGE